LEDELGEYDETSDGNDAAEREKDWIRSSINLQ
jgi:hypothetical protein